MTDKDILKLIKEKRENAYNDYQYNYNLLNNPLNILGKDTEEYKEIKDKMKRLSVAINTYDDLIITINLNTKGEK